MRLVNLRDNNNKPKQLLSLTFKILNRKVGISKANKKVILKLEINEDVERSNLYYKNPFTISAKFIPSWKTHPRSIVFVLSFAFVVVLSVYIFQPWRECRSLDVLAMGI